MSATPQALFLALAMALGCALAAAPAQAQSPEDLMPTGKSFDSPEYGFMELRIGTYEPSFDENNAFETFFADDVGPLLELEMDWIAYRIPGMFYFGVAGTFGWAEFAGSTRDSNGAVTSEEAKLTLIPLSLMGMARFDMLSRRWGIPFNFAGKIGYQWTHWSSGKGSLNEATGWSLGLRWAVQLAIDLDTLEPDAARIMDEEWGINHTFIFFEIYGFHPRETSLPVGVAPGWAAGLGLVF